MIGMASVPTEFIFFESRYVDILKISLRFLVARLGSGSSQGQAQK